MNRCPLTYEACSKKYSASGLKMLSRKLLGLKDFPYSKEEQLQEAAFYATKISIQGVQPKLSVKLNIVQERFEIVDYQGTFILKPPHPIFAELVENEDVSMRLAYACGIEVPFHGMIYGMDGSLSYIIRRFDRFGHNQKLALEDFAQLSGKSRETKYESSMEQVAITVERYCTFPQIEKQKLLRLAIFSFIIGNEDLHLKNLSLLTKDGITTLSPSYDLINSTILLRTSEEFALPLMGKKSNINRQTLFEYYGEERLGLSPQSIKELDEQFHRILPIWKPILDQSFLSTDMRQKYLELIYDRHHRLYGGDRSRA